jgi:outer membrane protein
MSLTHSGHTNALGPKSLSAGTGTPLPNCTVASSFARESTMNFRSIVTLCVLMLATLGLALGVARPASAADMKIAVINLNRAINGSDSGDRSKKILLAAKTQKENELKAKETQLRKMVDDARSNMMLSDSAKAQKEKELRDKENDLRQDVQSAQQELQEQERKLTDSILVELKTVISLIAQERKYDLVLEQAASQVILFNRFKFDDITDEVVDRYNKMQAKKQ